MILPANHLQLLSGNSYNKMNKNLKLFFLEKKNNETLKNLDHSFIEKALLIRLVEEIFLELFALGKMNGTVHTCVGQEFSSVAVCHFLNENDWITSTHRCHGHFISKTGNWKGLVDELMGLKSGVCGGIGSSQHLYQNGFLSNGIQGSLLPVGTGIALHQKIFKKKGITVSFLGEGTLGEGIFYEAINLASLHKVPQLFICENNFYSQSTPQNDSVAGSIINRAKSFDVKSFECNIWDTTELFDTIGKAIGYVRAGKPAFVNIKTYRLNAHSKGDDDRDLKEVEYFKMIDPLNILLESEYWLNKKSEIENEIRQYIKSDNQTKTQKFEYCQDQFPIKIEQPIIAIDNPKIFMVESLNKAYLHALSNGAFMIGEDIKDPYGGAFKVTKGFSTKYPNQVYSSSLSEAGMVGISIGMSLMGIQSYTEIMFGDFISLTFDQLINNASKMHHMYNFQVNVPIRIRTPMGGKRGYGPTHSQSLEKFLVGIDNIMVIYLTSLQDPICSIKEIDKLKCPVIILENKLDYGRFLWQENSFYKIYKEDKPFGGLIISPINVIPTMTIVSYGEMARHIADNLQKFFEETDEIAELVCITQLHPIDMNLIYKSINITKKILITEDGSTDFGISSEILAKIFENKKEVELSIRIGSKPYPIPSEKELELQILPSIDVLITEFLKYKNNKQ